MRACGVALVNVSPSGLCECGCGQQTAISPHTQRARGYVKGTPRRFVHGHHGRASQTPRPVRAAAADTDHAWAAGILDGEGCIQISRSRTGHTLNLTVGQSSRDGAPGPMLLRLQSLYGGRIWEHRTRHRLGRRPHHVWGLVARQAEAVLRATLPYLVEKRGQAEIALEYRERGVGKGRFDIAAEYRARLQEAKR